MARIYSIIKRLLLPLVPFIWRMRIREMFYKPTTPDELKCGQAHSCGKIFFFLAADYGNLGDIAITHAQSMLLKKHYPDYQIIEIPLGKTFNTLKTIRKICRPNDIIAIVGGGNMGDRYYYFETLREYLVRAFKKNRIISFPQTIDFSDTKEGRRALALAVKNYSKHKNLTLMAREGKSCSLMRGYFPQNNVLLAPDLVLTLDYLHESNVRQGLIVCMRDDLEKKLTDIQLNQILLYFSGKYKPIRYYDTHTNRDNLSRPEYMKELTEILDSFSTAAMVITDRLHGMIFSYITGTPAIVFPNRNSKIEESFKWIQDCGYVKFAESTDNSYFDNLLQSIFPVDRETFKKKQRYFEDMIERALREPECP